MRPGININHVEILTAASNIVFYKSTTGVLVRVREIYSHRLFNDFNVANPVMSAWLGGELAASGPVKPVHEI